MAAVRRLRWSGLLLAVVAGAVAGPAEAPLQFRIAEGDVLNVLHQEGPVAAHLLLSSGSLPRVLVAFPAGNSGVGLWFEDAARPLRWTLTGVESYSRRDDKDRMLHGIVASASVDGPLAVRDAVLGSVRVLRDYQLSGKYPDEVATRARIAKDAVEWSRPRLDGAAGYSISIHLDNGKVRVGEGEPITLAASKPGNPLRLRITALTGEKPLTPLAENQLLNAEAGDDQRSRNVLRFLAYDEKYLAGSWRFNTYFGRDTLMSVALLMPALQPQAIESGLVAVLQRLAPNGEVAHEEDIGEFAILRHLRESGAPLAAPIYDYKMIDDDFMLAPVAASYLLDHHQGRQRAEAFLARKTPMGEPIGSLLARNFAWVADGARPFARDPVPANLISLKRSLNVGNWRDSEDGLAGGRYPYDVNAALVPAAMNAIARIARSDLLRPYPQKAQQDALRDVERSAEVWSRRAPPLFRVTVNGGAARSHIKSYAANLGVSPAAALASLPDGDLTLPALALDAARRPIPIVHSDGGLTLLLREPPAEELEPLVRSMLRPFPAGLLTDAGLLVANPALVDADLQRKFSRTAYHGTVTWSWQQALLAAGLERQLRRSDLPASSLELLRAARERLWSVIERTQDLRTSELWSWRYVDGRYQPAPFGQSAGDVDESNAAQLWSTVYLAIRGHSPVNRLDTSRASLRLTGSAPPPLSRTN
jgi:hypothetical protein